MNEELRNRIVHRHEQGATKMAIARATGVSPRTVGRVLAALARRRAGAEGAAAPRGRPSRVEPFDAVLLDLLARYPDMTAVRAWEELRAQGFAGSYGCVKRRLQRLRPTPTRAPVVRFESAPGAQAQMDYATYDLDFTGQGRRRVHLFGYVLGYSRRQYLRFVEQQDFATTLREHRRAFEHLGGVAAVCLYDNMKVVVSRYEEGEPVYNAPFLSFATHYGFRPWACRPRRPQTKGKIERQFHYVQTNLLNARTFHSLEHLNEVTAWWLAEVADVRAHGETGERPVDRHERERPHLLPLPASPYPVDPVVYRVVAADGFLNWRRNFYSAPWRTIGRLLAVRVGETELIVYGPDLNEIARHVLFERSAVGQRREDPAHRPADDRREQIEELRRRFAELGEHATRFLAGLLETDRYAKDRARRVLALLATYRTADVKRALERAVRFGAFSSGAVERILAALAKPKSLLETLADEHREHWAAADANERVQARPTGEYQSLLEEPQSHDHDGEDGNAPSADPGGPA